MSGITAFDCADRRSVTAGLYQEFSVFGGSPDRRVPPVEELRHLQFNRFTHHLPIDFRFLAFSAKKIDYQSILILIIAFAWVGTFIIL
jgi:hypothetical protein